MIRPQLKETVQSLCPEAQHTLVQDFFERMGEDYLSAFSADQIAAHVQLSAGLGDSCQVQAQIAALGGSEFEIVMVGFDRLAQFSIFCGLLSAFALDIRAGDVYSFSRANAKPRPARIVDVFRVALKSGEVFDLARQREFGQELQTLAGLLSAGSVNEARARLNRFLTERIEKMNEPLSGLLSPVEFSFDNESSADWTVMEARSDDAFAFLYALSNALSMRGVNIHRVHIRSAAGRATDRFFIANRWGRKIAEGSEQDRLRLAVGMIKQFTHFLTEAPDPAKAMRHFDQFLDRIVEAGEDAFPDRTISFLAGAEGMSRLAHLLGSSDFLWNDLLRVHFAELLPVLENSAEEEWRARAADPRAALNEFKDHELFLIDVRHLLQLDSTLFEFSLALTGLAETVVAQAAEVCYAQLAERREAPVRSDGTPVPYAICALGKFGGREMGYASDLELLFVHDGADSGGFFETLARQIVDFIDARDKGIFHIDLRLRPHGDAGPWSASFDQFRKYYSAGGDAAPFERQALIKLRFFAGDAELGRRIEAHRDSFTYSGEPWAWKNALDLRRRQMHELVRPGEINVKYSAGGIVDIEYAAQYLQLINGNEHPEIRVPTTLEALDSLRRLQIVREDDYNLLHSTYLFLRNLIDALRIVRGDARDLVLPAEDSEEFKSLARRLGYRERDRTAGAARLAGDIRESMNRAHAYFVNRFDPVSSPDSTSPW